MQEDILLLCGVPKAELEESQAGVFGQLTSIRGLSLVGHDSIKLARDRRQRNNVKTDCLPPQPSLVLQ
jgi:hypothetical protein